MEANWADKVPGGLKKRKLDAKTTPHAIAENVTSILQPSFVLEVRLPTSGKD